MGRRVSVGIATSGGNVGLMSVDTNTISSVETNANLTLDPNGTGSIVLAANVSIESQYDLRLHDADNTNYLAFQAPSNVTSNYTLTFPAAQNARTDNALLADTSGNLSWQPVRYTYSVQNTSFSAVTWNAYFIDTSGGGVTVTLPSSPSMGDTIRLLDVAKTFDSNNLTISRNGEKIQGDSSDMTVNTEGAAFEIVYSNSTYGWRIFTV